MPQAVQRRYHHGNLREELLQRAEDLVRDRGAHALSLRELAREAGVSHAAPSRHFADRQALLDAVAVRGFERLGAELEAAAGPEADGSFDARLVRVATAYVRFAVEQAALLDLMFAAKHRAPDGPVRTASDRTFAGVLALIAEGQARGTIAPGDAAAPGLVLFAALQGLASICSGGVPDGRDIDTVVRDAVALLLTGLRPR
ncbi:MAG TPA: TetR/AcrR family transcriptional regulator [Baekduia sp.]|nr:TetR/AcrR family transcriptional regulator [Baekduia sp.]